MCSMCMFYMVLTSLQFCTSLKGRSSFQTSPGKFLESNLHLPTNNDTKRIISSVSANITRKSFLIFRNISNLFTHHRVCFPRSRLSICENTCIVTFIRRIYHINTEVTKHLSTWRIISRCLGLHRISVLKTSYSSFIRVKYTE